MARRLFLLVLGGVGGGSLLRLLQASRPSTAVRPPGSVADAVFAQLCARCGNCFRSCPESIIVPDIGQTGVSGLLSPVLDFDGGGYCSELCNECGRKCPTRAIRRLALDEKRATAIGIARVVKRNCLGWTRGVYCMICRGACPYQAMGSVVHGGVDCPVVKDDLCRGCGACRSVCPVRPAKAIEVVGIEQRVLRV